MLSSIRAKASRVDGTFTLYKTFFHLLLPFYTFHYEFNTSVFLLLSNSQSSRLGQPLVFFQQQISSELRRKLSPQRVSAECNWYFLLYGLLWAVVCQWRRRTWFCHFAWHQHRCWWDMSAVGDHWCQQVVAFTRYVSNKKVLQRLENTEWQSRTFLHFTISLYCVMYPLWHKLIGFKHPMMGKFRT